MMIFMMRLKMLVQLQNTLTQKSNLNLWRPGIRFMRPVLINYFRLLFNRQGHARNDTPRLLLNLEFILLDVNTRFTSQDELPKSKASEAIPQAGIMVNSTATPAAVQARDEFSLNPMADDN
jgi:hypothetical protein